MLGDFHQFSPVGETTPWRTLLVLSCWFFERQFNLSIGRDSGDKRWIHRCCWAEGTEENIWSCMTWFPATSSTRYSVNAEHLKMLRSLIIGNEKKHTQLIFLLYLGVKPHLSRQDTPYEPSGTMRRLYKKVPRKGEADIQMYCTWHYKRPDIKRCILEAHRGKRNRGV